MRTEDVEAALARLMPPALSEECQLEIEELFDDGGTLEPDVSVRTGFCRWLAAAGGIAAAIGALIAIFLPTGDHGSPPAVAAAVPVAQSYGLVLVSESDRIESMTDEGWQEDSDGNAMHALRLSVVEENSLRDEETGIIVLVSEPREEILFTPITAF